MIQFGKPIGTLRQAWLSWLVVLSMVLTWVGGGTLSRAPMAAGPSAALAPAMAQDDMATLSTLGKTQRLSEFRPGHDPDDIAFAIGPVRVPQGVGIEGAQREAPQHRTAFAAGLPQPRAPPVT